MVPDRQVAAAQAPAELLSALVEGAPDGVLVVTGGGTITLVNEQVERLFGYSRIELVGESLELLVPDGLRERHRDHRSDYARSPRTRPMGEGRMLVGRRRDGTEIPVDIFLAPLTLPGQSLFTAFVRDASARAELEAELIRLALHDSLTGLANRTLVQDRLATAVARSERTGGVTAVLFVDIDRLKWINDNLGHAAGDALLRAVGARMANVVRPTDTVARVGGDEFVIVIENVAGLVEATALTERLLRAARAPVLLADRELRPTLSIGVALATPRSDVDSLLRQADEAMYRAKRQGGDRADFFVEG